jgi:hypothetical protein
MRSQRVAFRTEGDPTDPDVEAGAEDHAAAHLAILRRISTGQEVLPREVDAAQDVAGRVFCSRAAAVVFPLDVSGVVQESADEPEKNGPPAEGLVRFDGSVKDPGHREEGVGSVLQIVIPGAASGISRECSCEETADIEEYLFEMLKIVVRQDSA